MIYYYYFKVGIVCCRIEGSFIISVGIVFYRPQILAYYMEINHCRNCLLYFSLEYIHILYIYIYIKLSQSTCNEQVKFYVWVIKINHNLQGWLSRQPASFTFVDELQSGLAFCASCKHDTLNLCRFNVRPPSATLAQH